MIQALLVDLDGTLLENDVARFVPAYLKLLTQDLSVFGSPNAIGLALQVATQAMLANTDPERTLLRVFLETFTTQVDVPQDALLERIHRFYAETYPQLASMTRPIPGAAELLEAAAARGLTLAVATNPMLTRHAVEQRLEWAGVPVTRFDYALIASVESLHFAKPRMGFFAEVLAHLGRLPSEAVLVGNDPGEDLAPAAALGIPVFQVSGDSQGTWPGGSLEDARRWIEAAESPEEADGASGKALIARLEGQMATLLGRVSLHPPEALRQRPPDGGLSLLETLCHLRDVDREVNLPRLEAILREDNPFLSAVDTDEWIRQRAYNEEDPVAARAAFAETRRTVLQRLVALSDAEWRRPARHSLLGPITLGGLMAVLTEHEVRHLPPAASGE